MSQPLLTREEILANRIKFVKGLQEEGREKAIDILENINNPSQRCCLGHGCNIFDIERHTDDENGDVEYGPKEDYNSTLAPGELVWLLGLKNDEGAVWDGFFKVPKPKDQQKKGQPKYVEVRSLVHLNDTTELTTNEIGKLLDKPAILRGGKNSPFIKLSEFPKTVK